VCCLVVLLSFLLSDRTATQRNMIGCWHHHVVRLSVRPSVSNDVHCSSRGWCLSLKRSIFFSGVLLHDLWAVASPGVRDGGGAIKVEEVSGADKHDLNFVLRITLVNECISPLLFLIYRITFVGLIEFSRVSYVSDFQSLPYSSPLCVLLVGRNCFTHV